MHAGFGGDVSHRARRDPCSASTAAAWRAQNVTEELDPVLEPVFARAFYKRGNQVLIRLGDKEIDYSADFQLFITTKLANPTYSPEVSTKVMVVNFAVKEDGLEAQLLSLVVKMERPALDTQKNELIVRVAQGKRTQVRPRGGRSRGRTSGPFARARGV